MKTISKQSKISIKSILCVSILIVGISAFSSMSTNATTVSYEPSSYSSLIPHDSISITYDSNFTDYGFSGSGIVEDPYLIDGYNITTTDYNGIYITDTTEHFVISNCYVDATYYGIFINDVADGTTTVINNTCNNNLDYGIILWSSDSSTTANNTCRNNGIDGIYLLSSDSSTVVNNTCTNNNVGIYLSGSSSSTVSNNTCSYNNAIGIHLSGSSSSTVANNTCSYNTNSGIYIGSSGSSTVSNNTCSNNWEGIYFENSGSSTVANNTCNNNDSGIYIGSSGSSTVANNTCNSNHYGIYLGFSGSSTVANNTCSYNDISIWLYFDVNSDVTNNMCSNNLAVGIYLYSSTSSTVANNTFSNNNGNGIYLSSSAFCVVTYNLLQENEEYGVYLKSDSDNNTFHHNNFVDNNLGGTSQAYDECIDNFWYDTETLEGNYWSDWSGTGSYAIDGSAGSVDLYPLDEPTVYLGPPVITNIIHSPSSPTELDTVTINATVTDDSGVQSVTLHYRVNGGTWIEVSMTPISGDLYSVTIGSFAVSDTIEYYITAVDNSINHNEVIEDNGGFYYVLTIGSSDTIGPSITDIIHSPSPPTDLDSISINATVTDTSDIYNVTLHYRVNGGTWTEVSMTLVSGDIYSVTIGSYAGGDTIEYYVSAIDNSINHNEAINDNFGLYYSFTVSVIIPEFQTFSLLLPAITMLFFVFGLVVQQRRKK